MRVLYAYTRIHPLADQALHRYAPQAERVNVSRDVRAYAWTLSEWWARRESFLNVEHDIEIHERVLKQATYCPQPWCVWPYMGPGWPNHHPPHEDAYLYQSLGCVRFHRRLLEAEPDAMQMAAGMAHGAEFQSAHWLRMDAEISPWLIGRGYHPHIHWPAVIHHHVYGQHGCACGGQHG